MLSDYLHTQVLPVVRRAKKGDAAVNALNTCYTVQETSESVKNILLREQPLLYAFSIDHKTSITWYRSTLPVPPRSSYSWTLLTDITPKLEGFKLCRTSPKLLGALCGVVQILQHVLDVPQL